MTTCVARRASLGTALILGILAALPQGCTTSAPTTTAQSTTSAPTTSAQTSAQATPLRRRASPDGSDPAATLAKSLARPRPELPPLGPPERRSEAIPLDSTDPRYNAYLSQVREKIKEKWGYPCIRSGQSCEYKEAALDVEFGVLQDGRVQFVNVVHASEYRIYDEYAVSAVRLASPFPPVPFEMIDAMKNQTLTIRARFAYFFQKGKR